MISWTGTFFYENLLIKDAAENIFSQQLKKYEELSW